jgi:hypothetical protein
MAVSRFEGSSPVARYWLANCKGFTVRGGAHGVVEQLIHDADSLVPTRLVVRTRSRRKTIVPALAIESVVPANRVLVVERRSERRHVPTPRPASAVRLATRTVVPGVQAAGKRVASAAPPTKTVVVAAGRRSRAVTQDAWRIGRPAVVRGSHRAWSVARPMLLALLASFGTLVVELRATASMIGRRLREVDWRSPHWREAVRATAARARQAWRRPAPPRRDPATRAAPYRRPSMRRR